jgi:predicted RNA-binding protein with PUA domain
MVFSREMVGASERLEKQGHIVVIPKHTKEYALLNSLDEMHGESVKNKIEHDLIRDYYEEIKNSDAILILNLEKSGVENYIGGNSFLEMGFAHVLNKKIYLLNPIPEIGYSDEIIAMQPMILDGNLNMIK